MFTIYLLSLSTLSFLTVILVKCYLKLSCGLCRSSKHLVGKVVIVTGANGGIGFETAKDLADRGAKVILGCRDKTRGQQAEDKIRAETGNENVHYRNLDLASLASVRQFAESIKNTETRLDVLINNAGAIGLGNRKTKDGLLMGTQINHFGPFLLTNLLLPLLKSSAPSRIINVSSLAHMRGEVDFDNLNMEKETVETFSEIQVYCNSKLYNILMTIELDRQLTGTGVTANCLHPGTVQTDIMRNVENPFFSMAWRFLEIFFYKNMWEGSQTTIHCAVAPELGNVSGKYFSDCRVSRTSKIAQNKELARKLWDKSVVLTNYSQKS